jgi:glycine cleavage system H protein
MSKLPGDLKYTESHEWVYLSEDGIATVGITDHAQESLGDITFVELPLDGAVFAKGESFGVIESVKAASDLYAPLSGTILEVNPDIDSNPELINDSPYELGWLIRLEIANPKELKDLLDAKAYQKLC